VFNDDFDDNRLRLFDTLGMSSLSSSLIIYLGLRVAVCIHDVDSGRALSLSLSSPLLVQRAADEREERPEWKLERLDVTVEAGCAGTRSSGSD
jgi:hypothetical protein